MMELAWNYLARVGALPSPACQPPTKVALETIYEQTRVLSSEFVYYFARNSEPESPVGMRMRKWVDRVNAEYRVQFEHMISMLNMRKKDAVETLLNIAPRLLEKEADFSWGRVATMLTFVGLVARKLTLDGDEEFLEKFSTAIGNYLVETTSEWIFKQGGWDSFVPTTATNLLGHFGTMLCVGFGVAAAYTYTAMR